MSATSRIEFFLWEFLVTEMGSKTRAGPGISKHNGFGNQVLI